MAIPAVFALALSGFTIPVVAPPALAAACPSGSTSVGTTPSGDLVCQVVISADDPNWSPPPGITSVDVVLVGGGGGGSGAKRDESVSTEFFIAAGNGGGGGEVVELTGITSFPVAITIGTAGAGGVNGAAGGNGGNTVFDAVTATGGSGGESQVDKAQAPTPPGPVSEKGGSSPGFGGTSTLGGTGYVTDGNCVSGRTDTSVAGGGGAGAGGVGIDSSPWTGTGDPACTGPRPGNGGIGALPRVGLFAYGNLTVGGGGGGGISGSDRGGSPAQIAGGGGYGNMCFGSAFVQDNAKGQNGFGGGGAGACARSGSPSNFSGYDGGTGGVYARFLVAGVSSDAKLQGLTVSDGSLSPAFDSATNDYAVTVNNATSDLTVTPTVNEANATVTVDGTPVASGSASAPVPLVVGTNAIVILVTAQDGTTTETYTIAVTRSDSPSPPPLPSTPSAPGSVSLLTAQGEITVMWAPATAPDDAPVIMYRAVASPGGQSCRAAQTQTSCVISGLRDTVAYTVSVSAINAGGMGPAAVGGPVTPGGVTPAPAPAPLPQPLVPGESLLLVNGVPDTLVRVDPNASDSGLQITGDNWSMDLDGLGTDGQPLTLGPGGVLRLLDQRDVATTGTGFRPNSNVDLYVDPPVAVTGTGVRVSSSATEAIFVGSVRTDSEGRFDGTAQLPADIAPGEHVLQAVGYSPSAQVRAMNLGVLVDPWIALDQGTRTAQRGLDRIRTTGETGGFEAGTRLTPWIRYSGQSDFQQGRAAIRVQADGSFTWTRKIRANRGLTAYVSFTDTESNRVVWSRVR